MAKLPTIIVVAIFTVLFFGANGEKKSKQKRDIIEISSNVNVLDWLCQNNQWAQYFSWCAATTTIPPQTTTSTAKYTKSTSSGSSPSSASSSSTSTSTSSTSAPTAAESATWCQFSNGTYLALGQTYMQMPCLLCLCSQTHNIVCNSLSCMSTLCIDNTTPTVKPGACCATCAYDTDTATCTQNGLTFPHGTIIKTTDNSSQCWCQSGTIECRRTVTVVTTVLTTWESFSNNSTAYIVVIIICIILILGSLFCCGCGILYYYYYHNQQQAMQQAYEQYYNNAGWQPMAEDGQFAGVDAKEKEAEGEQNQFEYPTGHTPEFIPPPYAVYTGPYGSEEQGKDSKHV